MITFELYEKQNTATDRPRIVPKRRTGALSRYAGISRNRQEEITITTKQNKYKNKYNYRKMRNKALLLLLSFTALTSSYAINIAPTDLNATPAELAARYGKPVKIESSWF